MPCVKSLLSADTKGCLNEDMILLLFIGCVLWHRIAMLFVISNVMFSCYALLLNSEEICCYFR